ncbi:MAG TPA: MATE family efflux transporter [Nitrospiraceae bacterium]|nr:MATE family efflux transporter [Nitrospiraceae bacterium]
MPRIIRKQVFSLALPVVLSSLLLRSVGIVDIFLVGGLGATAIAAVGIAQIMVFLSMSVSWGINIGVTVLVSQLWGAGRKEDAGQAAFQALMLVIMAALVIMILGLSFGNHVALFLGASPEVQGILSEYTRIIFSFIFFSISMNVLTGIMHGTGDTKTPLYSTLLVNILHILVAYPLIYGHFGAPMLGVKGAAIAVAVSEGVGTVFLLIRSLFKKYIIVRRRFETKYTVMTVKLGLPILLDRVLQNTGSMLFAKIVLRYGTAVYAAHQVGLAIEAFSFMPGYGISVAAATLVGQKLGAGRPEDARLSAFEARRLAVVLMAFMGLIFFFFPYGLLRAFTNDPEVVRYGVVYMKIVAFSQIPLALTMVLGGSLRGAGDTKFLMLATISGMWLVRLPIGALLATVFALPIVYVWSAMVLDWLTRMGLLLWRYHRESWGRLEI